MAAQVVPERLRLAYAEMLEAIQDEVPFNAKRCEAFELLDDAYATAKQALNLAPSICVDREK